MDDLSIRLSGISGEGSRKKRQKWSLVYPIKSEPDPLYFSCIFSAVCNDDDDVLESELHVYLKGRGVRLKGQ